MAALKRFIPLLDRVLVQRFIPETTSKGGILLPETSQSKMNEATVIAVGPGFRDENGKVMPIAVNIDDKVLLPDYGGTKIELNGEEYHIFRENDILGKLE